jgi:hypothetical protein
MRVVLERLWERRAEVAKKTGKIPELIFTAADGKPFTYWRLRGPWENARGDRRLRLHDLRASRVTKPPQGRNSEPAVTGVDRS